MEYPEIESLVPEKEHFDSSVVNGGVWLTDGHVNAIESALQALQTATASDVAVVQSTLTETETKLVTTQGLLTASETLVSQKGTTVVTQAARIQELEGQVKELGGKPSGTGSTTVVTVDPPPAAPVPNSGVIAFDSPEHPANIQADQLTGSKMVRSI